MLKFNSSVKLTLKTKIILVTSMIMLISCVAMSTVFYKNVYNHTVEMMSTDALNVAKAAALLIDGDEFETLTKELNKESTFYKNTLNQLRKLNTDIGNGMVYTIANTDSENYTYIIDGSTANTELGYKQTKSDFSSEAGLSFEKGESYISEPYYVSTFDKYYVSAFVPIKNTVGNVVGIIEYDYEGNELSQKMEEITALIITMTVVFVLLSILINLFVLRILFRPMDGLVNIIHRIAEGDLTVDIDTSRSDEIGKINNALKQTVDALGGIIATIQNSTQRVATVSENILISSTSAAEAYEELANSTGEISSISNQQAMETKTIKTILENLDVDVKNIFTQINRADEVANKTLERTQLGVEAIRNTQGQMDTIGESIGDANDTIKELAQNMGRIQGIVASISGIANQTNLLALNAAIEAARAGESGKGFAVVADEVRKLAESSNVAANEIVEIIRYINDQTQTVSDAIETSVAMTKEGKDHTNHVESTFNLLKDSNRETQGMVEEIKKSASEVVLNLEQITTNMNQLDHVSQAIDMSAMNLAAVTEEQMATSEEFKSIAEILNSESEGLKESINIFKV